MENKTGRFKVIEQFLADDITCMFGNPGTVEQGFLDAISAYPEMQYYLTLQESVAVMVADGYARATKKPTLVQLHSSPGIGNAVGALYQAKRGHAPLVVIGGDAGTQYMNMDAQMANDLVAMMQPVTKYSTMVLDSRSLLRTLRRAIKIAATPPMGPVYVCLPQNILDEVNDEKVFPTSIPSSRVIPEETLLVEVAELLLEAEHPIIYMGDGVSYSGAEAELERVAELIGARVYGADVGDLNMDMTHPCYHGTTGHMFGSQSLPITREGDVNLVVGTYLLPEVYPELGDIFADGARVIHFDLNDYEIAKNHRVDIGAVCDPRATLTALNKIITERISDEQRAHADTVVETFRQQKADTLAKEKTADESLKGLSPLHMAEFALALAERVGDNTVIFDEALTNFPPLVRYLPPQKPGSYFVTRGGSLGVGIPGAMGVKTAYPEKTVIGFSGDGGSMYTIQALWSAARHGTGAKFIICNNSSYRLLQMNIDAYWKDEGINPHDHPICFDLSNPAINFAQLAKSMGVDGVRVEKSAEIVPAIEAMLKDDRPFLIDLVLEGDYNPQQVGVKCGQ